MNIDITIKKDRYGSKFAYADDTLLFQFEERTHDGSQWYFWPAGNYNPTIFNGQEFPMEYFTDICKALSMVYLKLLSLPDNLTIVKGKTLLKWMK